jgi:O-antigen/teichoic acid export membrane protein
VAGVFTAVRARLPRDDMQRSAVALAANTAFSSMLGFLFWILAARLYTPAVVGESAALISAMLLMANIAELNLYNALIRFLPTAGSHSLRYVLRVYLTVGIASLLVGLAALPFLREFGLVRDLLRFGPMGVACVLGAVLVWTLFALKDSIAIGARAALWVPVANAAFGVAKLLLVIVLAGSAPQSGVFSAWLLAMLPVLALMNALIFWRLLPGHAQESTGYGERITRRAVLAFMTVDNVTIMGATAVNYVLPVMVAALAGHEANGYFFAAWAITSSLDVALVNVASSLTVEGARQQDRLGVLVATLIGRIAVIAVPLVALVVVAAPVILSAYGDAYVVHSTDLLRVIVLAVIPRIAIVMWMNMNRVRQRLGRILAAQGFISVSVLGLSWAFLPQYGIIAVGLAHLAVQSALAIALLPSMRRVVVSCRRSRPT